MTIEPWYFYSSLVFASVVSIAIIVALSVTDEKIEIGEIILVCGLVTFCASVWPLSLFVIFNVLIATWGHVMDVL